ncbi:MAG: hypothetical protein AAGF12_11090 [Myxococcota bacterium]
MNWILQDRRQRRSSDRFVALRYQLEYSRENGGLEALVLANDDGLLVASSGDSAVCAELGAVAPLMSQSVMGMPLPPLLRGTEVAIRRVAVYGQQLYLAAVGGNVARDAHLRNSMSGVERILTYN